MVGLKEDNSEESERERDLIFRLIPSWRDPYFVLAFVLEAFFLTKIETVFERNLLIFFMPWSLTFFNSFGVRWGQQWGEGWSVHFWWWSSFHKAPVHHSTYIHLSDYPIIFVSFSCLFENINLSSTPFDAMTCIYVPGLNPKNREKKGCCSHWICRLPSNESMKGLSERIIIGLGQGSNHQNYWHFLIFPYGCFMLPERLIRYLINRP